MRNYMVYTMCYWDYNDLFHKNNHLKLAFLVSANFSQFWPFLTNFGQLKFIFAGYLLPLWCLLWPAQCAPPLQPRSRLPSCYQDGRLRLRSEHERKRKVCRFAVFFFNKFNSFITYYVDIQLLELQLTGLLIGKNRKMRM